MKNSKEIASTVFQVRDEYMEHQEVKNRKIRKAAAVSGMACALCLTVVGAGYMETVNEKYPVMQSAPENIAGSESTENYSSAQSDYEVSADSYVGAVQASSASSENTESTAAPVVIEPSSAEPQNEHVQSTGISVELPSEVQQNPESNTVSADNTSSSGNDNENAINHYMKHVIVNGEAYIEYNAGTKTYTPDTCLGSPSDYDGNYRAFFSEIHATLYTSKESPEILIVEEPDNVVYLIKVKD